METVIVKVETDDMIFYIPYSADSVDSFALMFCACDWVKSVNVFKVGDDPDV